MIQVLTRSDVGALAEFFARNKRDDVIRDFNPFPLNEETAQRLCNDGPPDWYFAYREAGVIKALGMLRGWREGFAIPSFGLLVDHESAGLRLGTSLTFYAVGLAKGLGCTAIRLTVQPDNAAALRLYSRAGLKPRTPMQTAAW